MRGTDTAIHLINKMFEIAGYSKTYEDIKDEPDFHIKYTMTEEQQKEFLEYGAKFIKKAMKFTKAHAEREMEWFNFRYGLKIKS